MNNKKHIFFWIAFPIGWTLITLLLIFYYDLANGPLALFIILRLALKRRASFCYEAIKNLVVSEVIY